MISSRKIWIMIMVLCFVPIIISGCKDKESNVEADTGGKEKHGNDELFKLGEEPLEITMFGNYDWYTMPLWGEDVATKWIKENKKVDITAIDGGGNAAQRLSTMIASNDLPDFIWLDKGTDVERLRKGGALVPLDPYLDKYTNLQEWFGESGINMLRSEDGKLYQYPNWYNAKPFGNAGYVVNKGIYEELGSPPLETTEDLYNYLKQVKENYPNITPFETDVEGQGINVLYSAFAENQSPANIRINAVPEGDKLTSIFTNEEYVESLQYASKLYREGLITQDALTQDRDMVTEKVSSGRVAVYASASPTDLARP
ncbi:extracellular solute-binding protein [Virgibacillus salarius]|nr:extracellular solute-binding protein [Virgibacillus salarius]WBX82027.1 extracellular solute-binding protein [Virgibacillus salarius]